MSLSNFERPSIQDVSFPAIELLEDEKPYRFLRNLHPESTSAIAIKQNVADLQADVEALFPDVSDGLNLAAIQSYFSNNSLITEPYRILSADDLERMAGKLQNDNITGLREAEGLYSPYMRYSLVKRTFEKEEIFGPQFTERIIVHEQAHSTSSYDHIQTSGSGLDELVCNTHMPRIGFRYIPYAPADSPERNTLISDAFTEEAFAEYCASDYVAQHYSSPFASGDGVGFPFRLEEREIWIPARYTDYAPVGDGTFNTIVTIPALAAYALELYDAVDPDHRVIDAMYRARTDGAAITELYDRLDSMGYSGISDWNKSLPYTIGGFVAGLEFAEIVANEHGIRTRPQGFSVPREVHQFDRRNDDYEQTMDKAVSNILSIFAISEPSFL